MKIKNFFKKTGSFFKRNAYYVILFVCISGIATMITLAAISSNNPNPDIINNDGNNDNNGGNNNDNNNDNDQDVNNPAPIMFILPVENYVDGMLFSGDDFIFQVTLGDFRTHKAMDFITEGSVKVYACYDGVVDRVYKTVGEGNVIVIKHNDELFTIYKSLSDDVKVQKGYTVKKGDHIGFTSDSMLDEFMNGHQLHLEVLYKGNLVDPMSFMEEGDK